MKKNKSIHEWPFRLEREVRGTRLYAVIRKATRPYGPGKYIPWLRVLGPRREGAASEPFAAASEGWQLFVARESAPLGGAHFDFTHPCVRAWTQADLLDVLGQMDKKGGGLYASTLRALPVATLPEKKR